MSGSLVTTETPACARRSYRPRDLVSTPLPKAVDDDPHGNPVADSVNEHRDHAIGDLARPESIVMV